MSILLDALKKSEEQRQLGMTPTIHSGVDKALDKKEPTHQWLPATLMALAVVVMVWFGRQQFRPPASDVGPAEQSAPEEVHQAAAQPPLDVPATTPESERPLPEDTGAEQRTPVESFIPEETPAREMADSRPQQPAEQGTPEAETAMAAAKPEQASPDPVLPDRGARQKRTQPVGTEPISYWELPQGIRDDLPEFRITVLVFAEHSQDRFLLLNGQRLVEKDSLQDGLILDEIRRDGAVFRYRNYRFLVKGR